MQTPPLPFSFGPVFMDDGKCAEQNEKNNKKFPDFYFSSYREKFMMSQNDQKIHSMIIRPVYNGEYMLKISVEKNIFKMSKPDW